MRPEDMVGHMLGHYRITRLVGYGGSAVVFLAQDIHLRREVALKVFRAQESQEYDFLRRFEREARVVAQLDHPHILPVYDYGEQDDNSYLVMPYIAGGSLRERLQAQTIPPLQDTLTWISQVLKALQYAHEHGLIHRDVKPGNMLIKADGTLLLSDFGMVKVLPIPGGINQPDNNWTTLTANMIAGTPDYMAPEQITGKATPATDIYATGVVLYEMLSGAHLFTADNYLSVLVKHLHEEPRPLRALQPELSPLLEAVVMRALEKDQARRYQSAEEMHEALLQATTHNPVPITLKDSVSTNNQSHVRPRPFEEITQKEQEAAAQAAVALPVLVQPHKVHTRRKRRLTSLIAALVLLLLALGSGLTMLLYGPGPFSHSPPKQTPQIHPSATNSPLSQSSATVVTRAVPPTTTDCPTTGTAHQAITAPLTVGDQQTLVYIQNGRDTTGKPAYGALERRVVGAGTTASEITRLPGIAISGAQVANDRQWVLFSAQVEDHSELRMVRMDGQGLQTLYCTSMNNTISDLQWSYDEHSVVFNVASQGAQPVTYLLDMVNGIAQAVLIPQSNLNFIPRVWVDNRYVYMTAIVQNSDAAPQNIYILDAQKGPHQHDGDLKTIVQTAQSCTSFDSSYDLTRLFVSNCTTSPPPGGGPSLPGTPSTITVQPATGGTARPVLTSPTLAITTIRAVKTGLLLLVENYDGDSSQNGLWKINTDGTGLSRLTTDTEQAQALCQFTQYAWSNVSRDGSLFALGYHNPTGKNYRIYTGSLETGNLNQFLALDDGTQLLPVGWTTT